MTKNNPKLVFTPPDRNTRGFPRRMRQAAELEQRLIGDDIAPETIDAIVEFLLDFVTEPASRKTARELLWDASQEEFEAMFSAITGKREGEGSGPLAGTSSPPD